MMNDYRTSLLFILIVLSNIGSGAAWGQLFGDRSTGQPFQSQRSQRPAAQAADSDVGTLEGNERFLRDNRSRDAFVGSDRSSLGGFVGSEQSLGSGRVPAATETLPETTDTSQRVNRPLPPLPDGAMYYPRLMLGESFQEAVPAANNPGIKRDQALEERLAKHAEGPIQVLRRGDQAILRGTVESQQMANRLKLLVSFEPQIYEIEDQLEVASGR